MDCKVEDDDSGGQTHGDMSVPVPVPPNSSLPELLHGGQDVAVGGLVAPVPGLAVGIGWELVTVVSSLLPMHPGYLVEMQNISINISFSDVPVSYRICFKAFRSY